MNKIYFLTKKPKIGKNSKKLDYIKIKPHFIKFKKEIISYKFKLFKNSKGYSIFHVSLLKLVDFKILI